MDIKTIAPDYSVSPQISPRDVGVIASQGYRSIMINRPDGEDSSQPECKEIVEAASRHGLQVRYSPVQSGKVTDADVEEFAKTVQELPAPVLAYCRTGTRSTTLWALSQASRLSTEAILKTAEAAGYDLIGLKARLDAKSQAASGGVGPIVRHDVVIVGGGAAGLATAASMLKRRKDLDIAVIEPQTIHYYQPGWTLVGGGVFERDQTKRQMEGLIPKGVSWVRAACAGFDPERNEVILEDGERVGYKVLVAAPGLKLDWHKIDGLADTLGKNGVTSNYQFDLAPYTWQLVESLKEGRALFTQPPMPIKCAGAPQKAMYLSCDAWRRRGVLKNIEVEFHNAGGVLFGVKDYVPALMRYVERYDANLFFNETLVAVDGPGRQAEFDVLGEDGQVRREVRDFDMLHACPPQTAHDFIRDSALSDEKGWIEVDGETLQHVRYGNVFGLGDGGSTPNAKTAAAVRKQAPVVAHNALNVLDGKTPNAIYNGYGSCPLTVERGKIVLAEFAYGGKLDPSVPRWMLDGTKPSRAAWFLKEKMLPSIYFNQMLRGDETLAEPEILSHTPAPHEAQDACDFKEKSNAA